MAHRRGIRTVRGSGESREWAGVARGESNKLDRGEQGEHEGFAPLGRVHGNSPRGRVGAMEPMGSRQNPRLRQRVG